jgi:membrane associated rhomboid family serine protease
MLLADDLPLARIRTAWVTWGLMAACIASYIVQLGSTPLEDALALWPKDLLANPRDPHQLLRLLGYMFLHGSWLHLGGNLLVLFVFGDNVEDALGHLRFLLLYLLAGVAGGALHSILTTDPETPLVGASAAIAGVMAAYLLLYPRAKLFVLAFARLPVLLPASWFVAAWFGVNLLEAATGGHGGERDVAWWAHIGGFVIGLALVLLLRQPGVALFQPALTQPSERLGWLRRVSFDFAPQLRPQQPGEALGYGGGDGRLAALGKAVLFVVLLFFSAWF